jgi:hypothetical protein
LPLTYTQTQMERFLEWICDNLVESAEEDSWIIKDLPVQGCYKSCLLDQSQIVGRISSIRSKRMQNQRASAVIAPDTDSKTCRNHTPSTPRFVNRKAPESPLASNTVHLILENSVIGERFVFGSSKSKYMRICSKRLPVM